MTFAMNVSNQRNLGPYIMVLQIECHPEDMSFDKSPAMPCPEETISVEQRKTVPPTIGQGSGEMRTHKG